MDGLFGFASSVRFRRTDKGRVATGINADGDASVPGFYISWRGGTFGKYYNIKVPPKDVEKWGAVDIRWWHQWLRHITDRMRICRVFHASCRFTVLLVKVGAGLWFGRAVTVSLSAAISAGQGVATSTGSMRRL